MNMSAVEEITNAHAVIKRYPDALKALPEADSGGPLGSSNDQGRPAVHAGNF